MKSFRKLVFSKRETLDLIRKHSEEVPEIAVIDLRGNDLVVKWCVDSDELPKQKSEQFRYEARFCSDDGYVTVAGRHGDLQSTINSAAHYGYRVFVAKVDWLADISVEGVCVYIEKVEE